MNATHYKNIFLQNVHFHLFVRGSLINFLCLDWFAWGRNVTTWTGSKSAAVTRRIAGFDLFLIFTSCRTAMQHFEATMLFCVCVIAVFHHTDDPSLLHMSIFSSPWPYFDDDTSSLQNEPHLLEYPSGISDCHHKNWNKDVDISDIYRRLRRTWVTSRDGEANLSDRRRLVHLTEI